MEITDLMDSFPSFISSIYKPDGNLKRLKERGMRCVIPACKNVLLTTVPNLFAEKSFNSTVTGKDSGRVNSSVAAEEAGLGNILYITLPARIYCTPVYTTLKGS